MRILDQLLPRPALSALIALAVMTAVDLPAQQIRYTVPLLADLLRAGYSESELTPRVAANCVVAPASATPLQDAGASARFVEQVLAARQCDGVAGQGKTHVVRMVGDDRGYRFEPASLTIDANDAVRFEFVSGGPHNVAFDSATLSPAARAALARGMENPVMELASQMLLQPGGSVTVRFAGVPSGTYQFHCMPHLAMDHRGSITVR